MLNYIKNLNLVSKNFKSDFFLLGILMIGASVLEMFSIGIIIPLLSSVSNSSDNLAMQKIKQIFDIDINDPIFFFILIVALYFIKNIYLVFFYLKQSSFVSYLQAEIGQRLFIYYYTRPYLQTINDNSSNAIRNLTTETENVRNLTNNTLMFLSEICVALFLLIFLIFVNPESTLLILIIFSFSYFAYKIFTGSKLKKWGETRAKLNSLITRKLIHAIDTIKILKLLNISTPLFTEFAKDNYTRAQVLKKFIAGQNYIRLYIECFAIVAFVFLIYYFLKKGKTFDDIIILLSVYGVASFRLIPSINRILASLHSMQYNSPSLEIISKLLKYENIEDSAIAKNYIFSNFSKNLKQNNQEEIERKNIIFDELRFEDVFFSYEENQRQQIEDISFVIKRGDRVGIVGNSGAGKSTLVDLILCLLEPQKGKILLDTENLSKKKTEWQKSIGYVPQSIYLIDDTIKKNIALGISDDLIDSEKIIDVCKLAEIHDFIKDLPQTYDTFVGEKGIKLSGGQVQRIGIARALYHNPNILVFDEATSSLDIDNENKILNTLKLLKNIDLLLIISHKENSIKFCNKIIRIQNGKKI